MMIQYLLLILNACFSFDFVLVLASLEGEGWCSYDEKAILISHKHWGFLPMIAFQALLSWLSFSLWLLPPSADETEFFPVWKKILSLDIEIDETETRPWEKNKLLRSFCDLPKKMFWSKLGFPSFLLQETRKQWFLGNEVNYNQMVKHYRLSIRWECFTERVWECITY